jgi:large subunit ribosomal protein L25
MEQKTLSAAARSELKTAAARRLRRMGKIPAVIYGHRDPVTVTIDAQDFSREFKVISESQIVRITVDGESYDALIKDYQEDILTGRVEHIDFFEIEANKLLRANIMIHLSGSAIGAREGGIVEQPLHEVEVECLPRNLPEPFEVNISGLGIGDSVHVADLVAPEDVRILTNEDQVIVLVAAARAEPTEDEEEAEGEEIEPADGEEREERSGEE